MLALQLIASYVDIWLSWLWLHLFILWNPSMILQWYTEKMHLRDGFIMVNGCTGNPMQFPSAVTVAVSISGSGSGTAMLEPRTCCWITQLGTVIPISSSINISEADNHDNIHNPSMISRENLQKVKHVIQSYQTVGSQGRRVAASGESAKPWAVPVFLDDIRPWVKTYGTIFGWMNIHLPSILMFTRGKGFWLTPNNT